MNTSNSPKPAAAPAEERFGWERVLFGIKIIYLSAAAAPLLALLVGLSFFAVVDPLRVDEPTLLIGLMGFFLAYMLGVGGLLFGLYSCCQVPDGFPGRRYAQSVFVLTAATSAVTLLSCRFLSNRWIAVLQLGPSLTWTRGSLLSLLDFMLAASGGLAVISGLLFVRSVGFHLGERDLAERAWRVLRIFAWWLAGVILFAPLVEFLDVEAPWLRTVYGVWVWIGGAAVLLGVVTVVERMRRTLRRAVG